MKNLDSVGILKLAFVQVFQWLFFSFGFAQSVSVKPNVLFIIADDLNDNIGGLGEVVKAKTPNLDRLRQRSVTFTNAHCNVALCNPSRASLWTGLYPHTTGFYGYHQHEQQYWNNPTLKNAVSVFRYFQKNGYVVYGTGKIYNGYIGSIRQIDRDHYGVKQSFGPFAYDGKKTVSHPSLKPPYRNNFSMRSFGSLSDVPGVKADPEEGIPGFKGWWDEGKPFRYVNETDRDSMIDEKSAAWATRILHQKHKEPFFLTIGFMRPHRPQVAPQKYFDMYPLDSISIPPCMENSNDLSDVPEIFWKGVTDPEKSKGFSDFQDIMKAYPGNTGWKLWIQSYLACVSFLDAQVGKVLDALDNSPYKDNTIIVLTSDNGYHMGEKNYMFKLTVWEESTHIPIIIHTPEKADQPGAVDHPVSLVDLYPTLIDLAGLPENPNQDNNGPKLDGHSLRPFLENNDAEDWDGPPVALSVLFASRDSVDHLAKNQPGLVDRQHFTVRSKRYRYTLANNGQEELYDHAVDPQEWVNQATNPQYQSVKLELKNELIHLRGKH